MPREDIEFKAQDGTILRGWFYTSSVPLPGPKNPCIILCHGFGATKEMGIDAFAEAFTSAIPVHALVFDNRCLGASDGLPRGEILPPLQISDYSDAITHAQLRPEVDPKRIGAWGTSYSGAHVLTVGAIDRRVKAVVSQVRNKMLSRRR